MFKIVLYAMGQFDAITLYDLDVTNPHQFWISYNNRFFAKWMTPSIWPPHEKYSHTSRQFTKGYTFAALPANDAGILEHCWCWAIDR